MANVNHIRTNLVMVFNVLDEMGKLQTKRITLSNVRKDLTEEEIWQFGTALGGLSKHDFSGVERVLYEDILA